MIFFNLTDGAKRSASVSDSSRYAQNPTARVTFDVGNAQKKISKFGFELVDGKISSLRDPRFDNFTKFLRTSSHDVILERLQDIHLGTIFQFQFKSAIYCLSANLKYV